MSSPTLPHPGRRSVTGDFKQQESPRLYGVFSILEEDAQAYVQRVFYPQGIKCPSGHRMCTRLSGPRTKPGHFQCKSCRKIFSLRCNTPFEGSHLRLATWLSAIHLWFRFEDGLYPKYLQDNLGIRTRKTAREVLKKLNEFMVKQDTKNLFWELDGSPDALRQARAREKASKKEREKYRLR